jgi:hypothetical protein
MPIDTGLYQMLGRGVKSVADYDNEHMQGQQNKLSLMLNQQKADEYTRGVEDQNQLRTMIAGGMDPYQAMLKRGNVKGATDYAKSQADIKKVGSDTAENEAKTGKIKLETSNIALTQHRAMLHNVSDQEGGKAWLVAAYQNPDTKHIFERFGSLDEALRRFDQSTRDPAGFQKWKMGASMNADELVKMTTPDANARLSADTTMRGQDVTDKRTREEGAANRGVQMRGQNLTDARSREATTATLTKPFEVTGPEGTPVLVQQDKQGNLKPVTGYTPKGEGGKPLAGAVLKQITEARDNATTISRLNTSFKPEYAGKGVLGFGADMQLSAAGTIGKDKDSVEWWKNYRKQAELVERHALFGAALTPTEQNSWRSADIAPGMHPDVIKRNLATRDALAKRVSENTQQDMIDAGHSPERIGKIGKRADAPAPAKGHTIESLLEKYK